MLTNLLILVNVLIFIAISLLHFYWAFGGTWGLEDAMPEQFKKKFFDPKFKLLNTLTTVAVTFGLLAFAAITASNSPSVDFGLKSELVKIGTAVIAGIFLLRSIGDFRLVGFFKKEKTGGFAEKDSKIYSPLCLFIGVVSILIYLGF